MKVIGIIPCRYNSYRLIGKPLADIHGKPMMWHVYQQCLKSKMLNEVYIATDDIRIFNVAETLNMKVILTHGEHVTGTDRIAEAAIGLDGDYYVNIQGDEPMISPLTIDTVVQEIINCKDERVIASNSYVKIKDNMDADDPNIVKTILSKDNCALAFSRRAIPYYNKPNEAQYYKQLGLYAFKKMGLNLFINVGPSVIESTEQVEMYRVLENDFKIKMVESKTESFSVDTINDLNKVIKLMEKNK